jgi:hypothetical protein
MRNGLAVGCYRTISCYNAGYAVGGGARVGEFGERPATEDQVSAVIADVPAGPVSRGAFFRAFDPYRCVLIGGHARRTGRFRIGSFCTLVAAFGDLELDLPAAQLSQEEITLTVCSLAARVTVTMPANWRALDHVLVMGRRTAVSDDGGAAAAPLLRQRGTSLAGSFRLLRG